MVDFFFLGPTMWLLEPFFALSTNADEENLAFMKKLLSNYEQSKTISSLCVPVFTHLFGCGVSACTFNTKFIFTKRSNVAK